MMTTILDDDNYRRRIAKTNFEAASALSMDKIVDMYLHEFNTINSKEESLVSYI